jgi:hypothetical protein
LEERRWEKMSVDECAMGFIVKDRSQATVGRKMSSRDKFALFCPNMENIATFLCW